MRARSRHALRGEEWRAGRAADVSRRVPDDRCVHARCEAPPVPRALHRRRATAGRGVDRGVRATPARQRIPRLCDRSVRLGHLRGRPGADLGAGRVPEAARARAEVRQPDPRPDHGCARAQEEPGEGKERRRQLQLRPRHAGVSARACRAPRHYLPGTRVESIARRPGGDYEVHALRAGAPVTFAARALVVAARPTVPRHSWSRCRHRSPGRSRRSATRRSPSSPRPTGARTFVTTSPASASWCRRRSAGASSARCSRAACSKAVRRRTRAAHDVVGGLRNPEMTTLADGELTAAVEGELAALVGAGKPLWHEIVRWTHAIPQYTIGHLERIAAVDRAARRSPVCSGARTGAAACR